MVSPCYDFGCLNHILTEFTIEYITGSVLTTQKFSDLAKKIEEKIYLYKVRGPRIIAK